MCDDVYSLCIGFPNDLVYPFRQMPTISFNISITVLVSKINLAPHFLKCAGNSAPIANIFVVTKTHPMDK